MLKTAVSIFFFAAASLVADAQVQNIFKPGTVEGTVVYRYPSERFCFVLADDGESWRVEADASAELSGIKEGTAVSAAGDVLVNAATHQMYKATFTIRGEGVLPPPLRMTPGEMYALDPGGEVWRRSWYGRMLTVAGEVRDINRRRSYTQIVIGPDEYPVLASLPIDSTAALPEGLEVGANVRVTGIHMPGGMSGFDTLRAILRMKRDAAVLLLAGMPLKTELEEAREAGARGYLPKSMPWRQLVEAIRMAAQASAPFMEEGFETGRLGPLTPREKEILGYLALGKTFEETAIITGIGYETVRTHTRTIQRKLDCPNTTSAVSRAYELGILRP